MLLLDWEWQMTLIKVHGIIAALNRFHDRVKVINYNLDIKPIPSKLIYFRELVWPFALIATLSAPY